MELAGWVGRRCQANDSLARRPPLALSVLQGFNLQTAMTTATAAAAVSSSRQSARPRPSSVLWGFCVFAQIVFKAALSLSPSLSPSPSLSLFALSVCCPLSNQPISSVPPARARQGSHTGLTAPGMEAALGRKQFLDDGIRMWLANFGHGFYFGPSKGPDASIASHRSMPLPSTIPPGPSAQRLFCKLSPPRNGGRLLLILLSTH